MNEARTLDHQVICSSRDLAEGSSGTRKSAIVHIAVIACGAALFVINAFNTNVWYDESYSVAIASYPLSDIWKIGAKDVHPVLYYAALHGIFLIFGKNIIAYRLFTVAGSVVLSIIGFTHVRRLAGDRTGIMFSAFAYFLPWSLRIAFQIRMYSWLAVVVMLLFLYAWRLMQSQMHVHNSVNRVQCWAIVTICSVLSAYLHYYGAIAAFSIQAVLICTIVRHHGSRKNILIWLGCAALAVVCYAPWLVNVVAQVSSNSGGKYWIQFSLMGSVSELMLFPFNAPEFEHLMFEGYNQTIFGLALSVATLGACLASVYSYGKAVGNVGQTVLEDGKRTPLLKSPVSFGILVTAMTSAIALLASLLLGSAFLYYRYLTVCIGPVALAMAYVFARTDSKKIGYLACALSICCGLVAYYYLFNMSHSSQNDEVLQAYEACCETASQENGGNGALVLSEDIYTACILTVNDCGLPITYVAEFQNPAYECYEPNLILGETKETALENYHGSLVYCGKHEDARNLAKEYGGEVTFEDAKFHVYSGQWFDFAIISFK